MWLIYSREKNAWWRPERAGFTVDVDKAGRYTWAEIVEILGSANRELRPDGGASAFAVAAPRYAPPIVT